MSSTIAECKQGTWNNSYLMIGLTCCCCCYLCCGLTVMCLTVMLSDCGVVWLVWSDCGVVSHLLLLIKLSINKYYIKIIINKWFYYWYQLVNQLFTIFGTNFILLSIHYVNLHNYISLPTNTWRTHTHIHTDVLLYVISCLLDKSCGNAWLCEVMYGQWSCIVMWGHVESHRVTHFRRSCSEKYVTVLWNKHWSAKKS